MAAAHRMLMTFAVETFRSLNRLSGMSGARTRDSMTRNSAKSATAAPSRPSVCVDAQPVLVAVHDRVDREHQRRGHGDGAGDVEPRAGGAAAGRQQHEAEGEHRHADRQVDEEDPVPVEQRR